MAFQMELDVSLGGGAGLRWKSGPKPRLDCSWNVFYSGVAIAHPPCHIPPVLQAPTHFVQGQQDRGDGGDWGRQERRASSSCGLGRMSSDRSRPPERMASHCRCTDMENELLQDIETCSTAIRVLRVQASGNESGLNPALHSSTPRQTPRHHHPTATRIGLSFCTCPELPCSDHAGSTWADRVSMPRLEAPSRARSVWQCEQSGESRRSIRRLRRAWDTQKDRVPPGRERAETRCRAERCRVAQLPDNSRAADKRWTSDGWHDGRFWNCNLDSRRWCCLAAAQKLTPAT